MSLRSFISFKILYPYQSVNQFFVAVNIESVGAMKPEIIFIEAARVLKNKCRQFINELNKT